MYVVTLPAGVDAAAFVERARPAGADMLEVRGDLTPQGLAFETDLPILLSPRGAAPGWGGGRRVHAVDLEEHEVSRDDIVADVTVRSLHDYGRTPSEDDLVKRGRGLRSAGADVVKIATEVVRYADLVTLANVRDELRGDGPTVVLGMGRRAELDRLLSPWTNHWTYACLDDDAVSAPGQLTLASYDDLRDRMTPPLVLGIVGGPQMTTWSPRIHARLLHRHGIVGCYLEFPGDDFGDVWTAIDRLGVHGVSITAPHKEAAWRAMPEVDDLGSALKTINTAVRGPRGWRGSQTDVVGLIDGYPALAKARRVTIVGAGGVVPAVIEAVRRCGTADVHVVARNTERLRELRGRFGGRGESRREMRSESSTITKRHEDESRAWTGSGDVTTSSFDGLVAAEADVLIWAVSVDVDVALPPAREGGGRDDDQAPLAIDLRYGRTTGFMTRASAAGYRVVDGLPMLLHQAARQFLHFTERTTTPDDLRVLTAEIGAPESV